MYKILRSDFWGLENVFYDKNKSYFFDLGERISDGGFSDYSPEGVSSYFSFRYPVLDLTMFQGFGKLDSSTELNGEKRNALWRPRFSYASPNLEDAVETVDILLQKSLQNIIKGRKRIGVMLSGGLDSSLVLAMVKRHFPKLETFTYSCGFYGEDEFEFSDVIAKTFSDNHSKFILGKDDFFGENSILESLIKQKACPLHPNELPLAFAQRKARLDLCDIVLCGEGADDIFGGYGKLLRMYMDKSSASKPFCERIMDDYRYFSRAEFEGLINEKYLADDLVFAKRVFGEDSLPEDKKDQMFYFIQRLHTKGLVERGMNTLRYNGFSQGFPFLDSSLVEYTNSLPFDFKVRFNDGVSEENLRGVYYRDISENYDVPKYILKKVAQKYLPHDIIYRKKVGFPVPFETWFSDLKYAELDADVFKTNDISKLNGWKKFMVLNFNSFLKIFNKYKI